jgi:RNA polymerase sigma-70 factor (ECF subfamily)
MFEARFGPTISSAASRLNSERWFVQETSQLLYQKLMVASHGNAARILEYSGRGPMQGWVRVAATRMAIDLRRKERGCEPGGEDLLEDLAPGRDPELDAIQARHAGDLEVAFRAAFESLNARERTVLRMYAIDGLDIGRIGAVYRVHRATVARWIARARDTLVNESHRLLADRLGATASEVDSLVRLVRSEIRVNLVDVLMPDEPSGSSPAKKR